MTAMVLRTASHGQVSTCVRVLAICSAGRRAPQRRAFPRPRCGVRAHYISPPPWCQVIFATFFSFSETYRFRISCRLYSNTLQRYFLIFVSCIFASTWSTLAGFAAPEGCGHVPIVPLAGVSCVGFRQLSASITKSSRARDCTLISRYVNKKIK